MFYIFKIFVLNLHQKPFPDCLYNKGIAPTDARKWHLGKANTLLGKALEEVGKNHRPQYHRLPKREKQQPYRNKKDFPLSDRPDSR